MRSPASALPCGATVFSWSLLLGLAAPAGAQGFGCDFEPTTPEVVLNTNFTMVPTKNCGNVPVSGGIFTFRSVRINPGIVVRGTGTAPLVFLVAGDVIVDGELSANGGHGARVDTLNSANFPTPGGVAHCGGGAGGRGSPNAAGTSYTGEAGFDPMGLQGGSGGLITCLMPNCSVRGSGGGGGTFTTAGDPHYPLQVQGNVWVQQLGFGGMGCGNRTLPGGRPGVSPFADARLDNDFFGMGVDLHRLLIVPGELALPRGGQGGGGGGDESNRCVGNPNWISDRKGGGGGAGGGVLIVAAGGSIKIGATGVIRADGGNGGGGEAAGGSTNGGGGGAGSGGMVVLYADVGIELQAHGETYANRDYSFAVSADGGMPLRGAYGGTPISAKYPPPSTQLVADQTPVGGMGGMGLVQFMTRPGANADGTNTVLDDNVHVLQGTQRLTGAQKQRYLAWRGYPQLDGTHRDDRGNAVTIGAAEGDIRPPPVLIPILR